MYSDYGLPFKRFQICIPCFSRNDKECRSLSHHCIFSWQDYVRDNFAMSTANIVYASDGFRLNGTTKRSDVTL